MSAAAGVDSPYVISVAADLAGVHPQTLRNYERAGLISPARSPGGARRYSDADLRRLARIGQLAGEGINPLGIKRILELEAELDDLRARLGPVGRLGLHRSVPVSHGPSVHRPSPAGRGPLPTSGPGPFRSSRPVQC